MTEPTFASLFPQASHDEWRKAADTVLKGKPFKTLQHLTYDGITVEPLYERTKSSPLQGREAGAPWSVSQLVDMPDSIDANKQALDDLEGGATALTIVCGGIGAKRGFVATDLKTVLDGVYLELIPIRIDGGNEAIAKELETLAKGLDTKIALGFDPVSNNQPVAVFDYKLGTFYMADGRFIHDAGGSEAQELAYVIACGVAYLRAGGSLSFLLAADQNQFLTTAKFRALRLLWAKIEEAFGLPPSPIDIHAETAWRMMTKTDSAVNWLRATTAVFAAGIGGANHITVLPRTAPFGLPDAFDRRMARNMQLVLLEESGLAAVSDPASGAGGIETLTDQLCLKAWDLFQTIEAKGGIVEAKAWLMEKVAKVSTERLKNIARRKDPLTGTTEFVNPDEVAPSVLVPFEAKGRNSEEFEALRGQDNPVIFIATLGNLADFSPRVTFARGFFESGGCRVTGGEAYADLSALEAAYRVSGTRYIALAGNDASYAEGALNTIKHLSGIGFRKLILCGKPNDLAPTLKEAGMTDYIAVGSDVIEVISRLKSE